MNDLDTLERSYGPMLRGALHDIAAAAPHLEPDAQVVSPAGRQVESSRRPRRLIAMTAAVTIAAGGAVAVTTLRLSSPPPDAAGEAAVAAWTFAPDAPIPRRAEAAFAWTGTSAVVWSGVSYTPGGNIGTQHGDGARYDVASRTWRVIAAAPIAPRASPQTVWTGTEVIVWGGADAQGMPLADGAAYNPADDSWRVLADAPDGTAAIGAGVVWTGSELVVWGGQDAAGGSAYTPATDSWRTLPAAPIGPRLVANAVWTGAEVIVWADGDGAAYEPSTDMWRALSPSPLSPAQPSGVWTGSEVLFLGGAWDAAGFAQGAFYDPAADSWRTIQPGPWHPGLDFGWTGTTAVAIAKGTLVEYDAQVDTWAVSDAPAAALATGAWDDGVYSFLTATDDDSFRIGFFRPAVV